MNQPDFEVAMMRVMLSTMVPDDQANNTLSFHKDLNNLVYTPHSYWEPTFYFAGAGGFRDAGLLAMNPAYQHLDC